MATKTDDKKGGQVPAKRQEAAVPAFMQGQAGRGLESLGAGDYEIPRLKLLTDKSPEVIEGLGKPGEFFHTILEQSIEGPIKVTPLFVSKSYILWRPRDDGGGILARADDGIHWSPPSGEFTVKVDNKTTAVWELKPTVAESRLAEWGTYDRTDPKSQPAATYMINVPMYMHDHPDLSPVVVTFQRGYVGAGRKFVGKLKLSSAPIYGRIFQMSSFDDENSNGDDYKNYRLEADGFVTDEALFKRLEDSYKMFAQIGVKVRDVEGLQDEASAGKGDGGAAAPLTEEQMKARGSRAY